MQLYGEGAIVIDREIVSRQSVFTSRANPSYRMEYSWTVEEEPLRGAVLITLGGGNAYWVFVESYVEDWDVAESVADEIFKRMAVIP